MGIKKTVIVAALSLAIGVTEAKSDSWSAPNVFSNSQDVSEGPRKAFDGSNVKRETGNQGWGRNVLQGGNNAMGGGHNVLQGGNNAMGGGHNVLDGAPDATEGARDHLKDMPTGLEAIKKGAEMGEQVIRKALGE